ncbi:MAG TPA: prepilin-type N-terminal cleavage/methylation domain-containing protein [Gemmatimonadales bacterium]|nr:prepilin-type N-terminal cleavage/methylation domain-containing protein [Gemmatimonadales bacterium]
MTRNDHGFTIVEVLVAVLVLTVGVTALVGSAGIVTRMIGQGRRTTQVAQRAERRLEMLRQTALAATPQCTGLTGGTATSGGITETWTVTTPVTPAQTRILQVIVSYPRVRGTGVDTLATSIRCN